MNDYIKSMFRKSGDGWYRPNLFNPVTWYYKVRFFYRRFGYWYVGYTWKDAGIRVVMDVIAASLLRRVHPAVWRFYRIR